MSKTRALLSSASVGACLLAAAGAHAQAQTPEIVSQVQAVVVTAERRSTDIQKTPVAITAVPAATLDKSFITNVTGLNAIVPSLETTKTSGFESIVTIRGVGSETPENDLTTVPGVSLFVDGVYVVNTISLEQSLFDIDHIEVLRGPQGALYGQSSIGGVINIVTNQPELGKFGANADFSVGNYDLTRERGEVNIPLGDTVAVRLSVQRFVHEGFTQDLAIPGFREDDADNTGVKAAILWKPVPNFSATLTGQWYRSNGNGEAQKNINDPEPSPWQIYQDYPGLNELTTQLYHLNLQYDFPWFSVRSVSAYQGLSSVIHEDSSRSAISLLGSYDDVAAFNTTLNNYTEEFDILSRPGGKLDWIAGAFILGQRSRQFVAEFEGTGPNPDLNVGPDIETDPTAYPNLAYGNDSLIKRQSYSAFVQATYHLTPNLRLTGGARFNYDHYTDDSYNFSAFGTSTANNAKTDHVATWRAELDYDATADNMLYASAARGYKPGGVNGNNTSVVVPYTFQPETNTAFEVGSKNFFFDRSLRLNAAAFYYLYKNMQYIEYDPYPFASGISNIPDVHIYGVEYEANYVGVGGHLHLNGSLALEDGQVAGNYYSIDSTIGVPLQNAPYPSPCAYGGAYYNPACWNQIVAAAQNLRGHTPPAMPEVSGSFDASYRFDTQVGSLTPRVQVVYRGSEWARIFNEPTLDKVPAYTVTNLNLEYLPSWSRLRFDITATNVFNVAGVNSQYTDPYGTGETSRQYIPPRQVIFTVGYSF